MCSRESGGQRTALGDLINEVEI